MCSRQEVRDSDNVLTHCRKLLYQDPGKDLNRGSPSPTDLCKGCALVFIHYFFYFSLLLLILLLFAFAVVTIIGKVLFSQLFLDTGLLALKGSTQA